MADERDKPGHRPMGDERPPGPAHPPPAPRAEAAQRPILALITTNRMLGLMLGGIALVAVVGALSIVAGTAAVKLLGVLDFTIGGTHVQVPPALPPPPQDSPP